MANVALKIALIALVMADIAQAQQPAAPPLRQRTLERVRQADAPLRRHAPDDEATQVQADPVDPILARDALIAAADEYVAESLPLTPQKMASLRGGAVIPFCERYAPDLEIMIGNNGRGPSEAQSKAIILAVRAAIIKRNLIRLGIPHDQAEAWTNAYYNDASGPSTPKRVVRATELVREQPPLAAAGAGTVRQGSLQRRDQVVRPAPGLSARADMRASVQAAPSVIQNAAAIPRPVVQGGQEATPERKLVRAINSYAAKPAGFPTLSDPASVTCTTAAPLMRTTPYRLRPVPTEGHVFLLPRFSFRLCELQKLDPYDRSRCRDWVDVSGQRVNLIGRYEVAAEWAGGKHYRSTRDFAFIDTNEHPIDLTPAP